MRVWDCHPRLLADKHLRAQHGEIHFAIRVIENNWRTKWKDVERFRSHPEGLLWLGTIHNFTVEVLQERGKFASHQTPVDHEFDMTFFTEYFDHFPDNDKWMDFLLECGYPPTQLNQGTPWERDGVSFEWYRQHEKDWTRALAKEEAKAKR